MSETIGGRPATIKIEESNCVSFKAGLHASFHRSQYSLLLHAEPGLLRLPEELMVRWGEQIDMEMTSPSKRRNYSLFTRSMHEKDRERRQLLTSFFSIIRGNLSLPDGEKHEAALKVDEKLHRFRGMQRGGSMEVLSGLIVSFEIDLEELTAELETLGLTPTVKRLHEANEAYKALGMQRVEQRVAHKRPTMLETRRRADACYAQACQYVQAAYINAASDEARDAIIVLVNRMNQMVGEHKKTYHEMRGQRRRYKKGKEEK